MTHPSPPPVGPGDVVAGKYLVERELGRGGMGIVVAARHVELRTGVAIKFLLAEAVRDREALARFQREARAAVSLKSVHAVRVMDVGKLPCGTPYMVMELLAGSDLGAVVDHGGPLPVGEAVEYVIQACEAVAEAHALGIIHRDLKPQNLFLTRGVDGRPLVKVLDFGLAKAGSQSPIEARSLTQSATIMGSPMYMSPEQMRAAKSVDVRSDIWSMGVCLFELLTGSMPFLGTTAVELCANVLKDPPRDPRALRADLPPALAHVLLRCLEKDPAARYANVGELAVALEPFAPPGRASDVMAVLERTLPTGETSAPVTSTEKDTVRTAAPTSPQARTLPLLLTRAAASSEARTAPVLRARVPAVGASTESSFTTRVRRASPRNFIALSAGVAVALTLVGGVALHRAAPAQEAGDETSPVPVKGAQGAATAAREEEQGLAPVEPAAASGPGPTAPAASTVAPAPLAASSDMRAVDARARAGGPAAPPRPHPPVRPASIPAASSPAGPPRPPAFVPPSVIATGSRT